MLFRSLSLPNTFLSADSDDAPETASEKVGLRRLKHLKTRTAHRVA